MTQSKKTIETKNFVVNSSKSDDKKFVWFVRHAKLNDGKAMVVQKGKLEETLASLRTEIMSL
jgi:DNA polymerase III epsilon subunit-like protein